MFHNLPWNSLEIKTEQMFLLSFSFNVCFYIALYLKKFDKGFSHLHTTFDFPTWISRPWSVWPDRIRLIGLLETCTVASILSSWTRRSLSTTLLRWPMTLFLIMTFHSEDPAPKMAKANSPLHVTDMPGTRCFPSRGYCTLVIGLTFPSFKYPPIVFFLAMASRFLGSQ